MLFTNSLILVKLRVWIDVKLSECDERDLESAEFHAESWLQGYYQALREVKERL